MMLPRLAAGFQCLPVKRGSRTHVKCWRRTNHIDDSLAPAGDQAQNMTQKDSNQLCVQVFDNVFSTEACHLLHELAVNVRGSFVFCRPTRSTTTEAAAAREASSSSGNTIQQQQQQESPPLAPLEAALDSVLTALGDQHEVVEYWTRQEYINMDVHADIDEQQLETEGTLRFPAFGHVLYLHVTSEEINHDTISKVNQPFLRAPTVLWSGTEPLAGRAEASWKTNGTTLTTVPAVAGRLLRFAGHALHAVPKPPTRFLLPPRQQEELDATEEEVWDEWDDEQDNEQDDDAERSVILFNTWSKEGPRGVPHYATHSSGVPEGITLDVQDEIKFLEEQKQRRLQECNELYGNGMCRILSNKRETWKPATVKDLDMHADQPDAIFLPLMGNQERRLSSNRFVSLQVSAEQINKAVLEASQPSKVHLGILVR